MTTSLVRHTPKPLTLQGGENPKAVHDLVHMLAEASNCATADVLIKLSAGEAMGLSLGQAMSLHVINGKPSMGAADQLARIQQAGITVVWLTGNRDTERAAMKLIGLPGYDEPPVFEFTIGDAELAGHLSGKNAGTWKKHTTAMLRARCTTGAIRMYCPGLLGATVYDRAEIDEPDEPVSVGTVQSRAVREAQPRPEPTAAERAMARLLEHAPDGMTPARAEQIVGIPSEQWDRSTGPLLRALVEAWRQGMEPVSVCQGDERVEVQWLDGEVLRCSCSAYEGAGECLHTGAPAAQHGGEE